MADEEGETDTRRVLDMLQSMIDISADRLEGLRTQCATSAELTQQEIRTLEGKLIKLFSRQLVSRGKLRESCRPSDTRNNAHSLRQWLQVVGLRPESTTGVCVRVSSIESLCEKSEHELKMMLNEAGATDEEVRRLSRALRNLKRYMDILQHEEMASPISEPSDMTLCWDSWDSQVKSSMSDSRTSPRPPRSRVARRSVPSSEDAGMHNSCNVSSSTLHHRSTTTTPTHHLYHGPLSPPPNHSTQYTPPTTPTLIKGKGAEKGRFPTTPPPRKKHQTGLPPNNTALLPDTFPLTKSRSHESQLSNKVEGATSEPAVNSTDQAPRPRRGRLPTEPGPTVEFTLSGHTSPLLTSPVHSPPYIGPSGSECGDDNAFRTTLQVPKSPRTPTVSRGMGHYIAHRFTKTFKMMTTCDYCDKQMFIGTGLKCKECKFKCHRDCESKVPPSCGLPRALVDEFARALESEDNWNNTAPPAVFQPFNQSPSLGRGVTPSPSHHHGTSLSSLLGGSSRGRRDRKKGMQLGSSSSQQSSSASITPYPGPDSSSNTSSCNSSAPSSPALLGNPAHPPLPLGKSTQRFHFPDVARSERDVVTLETHPLSPPASSMSGSHHSILSPPYTTNIAPLPSPSARARAMMVGDLPDTQRSNDSERTLVSSVGTSGSGSTDSERTPVRVDSQDSQVSDGELGNERSAWPRQNSLSLREWDIPFDELKIGEPIGIGRFAAVYRGNWHGAVAIKVLNMDNLDDEKTLEAFKSEVAIFRKTRHENLVLFMGACMKLPRLAIVTSMCKGLTLYTHIHLRKDKFTMNKTTLVAQQVSQGMGYLHARGIIHKDLKTKNIFYENGKVVITDFGLFSVTRLCSAKKGDGLSIPPGWLCYLAPEIIRSLRANQKNDDEDLQFTKASDVYAFGTVWYELLCGEWPFNGQPPEAIIWQVGKGMKQSLANLQASRDVKDILMLCWTYKGQDRPDFAQLLKTLEKLPKKRLARSPSHPVHLSRSAESVF